MKKFLKSSKNRKSLTGIILAAISLFTFNFSPISIIASKITSAAKYEATETKITEDTSTKLEANEIVSNLEEYFSDSNVSLNLGEYYDTLYQSLLLEKAHNYLKTFSDYGTVLGQHEDLKDYFKQSTNDSYLDFIQNIISNLNNYKDIDTMNARLTNFYKDLATNLSLSPGSESGITSSTTNFYNDSEYYKLVKNHIDSIIKQTISIVSYDGTTDNKVAAIIAKDAPTRSDYKYGSSYEKNLDKKYFSFATGTSATFDTNSPFFFIQNGGTYNRYETLPYETTSNGSLTVYAVTDGSAAREATYEFLGYKSITYKELFDDQEKSDDAKNYFVVPYSSSNENQKSYFTFLYNQLISNNIITEDKVTFEQFVSLFYTKIDNMTDTDSILCVKYDTSKSYLYQIYVKESDYSSLSSTYKFKDYVKTIPADANMNDYVSISSTTSSTQNTYKISEAGTNSNNETITLYFKYEIINYTDSNIIYLTDGHGNYLYETELSLDIAYSETAGKKDIFVLDESENASDNKIYTSLGYTIITTPTIDYVLIDESDDNYNENFKLYYKYADTDNVFAKNLLTLNGENPKNAVYILTSSVESNLTTICKLNGYTPLSKDELTDGFYTKINEGDPNYSSSYELYYKYAVSKKSDGTYENAKLENKIYEYISSSSEYNGFYKTDDDYNLEDYTKISKTDSNYKQGHDLYYKKQTDTQTTNISKNTTYSFTSKTTMTLSSNSYYVISFYANTTGTNVSASIELTDENNYLSDAKITGISTNGDWVKYYFFIATNLVNDSKIKFVLSMGSSEGISPLDTKLTGSVLFDEVVIYKINETDYNKQTINNEKVFALNSEDQKVDSTNLGNKLIIADSFSAREMNDAIISGWNSIFNFDTIDSSKLSNSQEYGGNLQNIDINNVDGYSEVTSLWQYFISRDVSGKNNSELLKAYRKAYKTVNADTSISSDVEISIIGEDDKALPTDDDNNSGSDTESGSSTESGSDTESASSIETVIDSTFNNDNKVLKIKNTSASMSLGVISKPFTVKASECYKLTLWIYAADEKSTATIKLLSSIKTAKYDEYGIEVSAGASDISAYFDTDSTATNEYRWLPVEFYIQGNALSDQKVNLVLLADENSTVYFDNIKIEKITTSTYSSFSAKDENRTFKFSISNSSAILSKVITNGFFNDRNITDLNSSNNDPQEASNWTVTTDAAQDYVTAGIISSTNTEFIDNYNDGAIVNNTLATNMYAININGTTDNPTATHKIYTSSSASLSASSVYKITFEYYYSEGKFYGDIISNLYYSKYDAGNKISSIRKNISTENESSTANKWNSMSFYVATGTSSVSAILELGVEDAKGTMFIRNVYATTISSTLDEIRSEFATNNGGQLTLNNEKIAIADFSTYSFTMNNDKDDDGYVTSTELTTKSETTTTVTSGKTHIAFADYFTETKNTEKTVTISSTTYYIYEDEGELKLYKYPIYNGSTLENNELVETISGKTYEIRDGKVFVGTGANQKEYEITDTNKNKLTYNFNNDAVVNGTTISANELKNNQSNNVLILANKNDTDYTVVESNYKMSLSSSSYYALKFYVKTSNFENDKFGLSISISATNLDISWDEDLINTTTVESSLNKDENGFVCYQLIISTEKSSYSDLLFTFSLGDSSNTGKGYAIISKIELTKLASQNEYEHYLSIFEDKDDDSIIKTTTGSTSSSSSTSNSSGVEFTWSTFFYIFSSLLLIIVLVIAMVAILIKKRHPITSKSSKVSNNENFDIDISNKNKEKIEKDNEAKSDGGIE